MIEDNDPRPSVIPYLIAFSLLIFAFAWVLSSQAQSYRYLIIRQTFVFERGNELPYESIRPMAYDDALGYVDIPIVNAYRDYVVIDLLTGNYAEVMASDSGCFVFWLLPEIGSDGMPHIEVAEWIVCVDVSS